MQGGETENAGDLTTELSFPVSWLVDVSTYGLPVPANAFDLPVSMRSRPPQAVASILSVQDVLENARARGVLLDECRCA